MESSPYKVKDDKVLLCQGVVVVVVGSSFDRAREPVASSRTGGTRDTPAIAALPNEDVIILCDAVAVGIGGGESSSSISREGFVISSARSRFSISTGPSRQKIYGAHLLDVHCVPPA
jgi:hypothetical protein